MIVRLYKTNKYLFSKLFEQAYKSSIKLNAVNKKIIEQEKEKYDLADYVTTGFSMIFNDAMFFGLRLTTIIRTKHAYFGAIFLCKEILSSIIRACMVVDNVLKRMRKDYHEV